jgi:hypothetical protein
MSELIDLVFSQVIRKDRTVDRCSDFEQDELEGQQTDEFFLMEI